MSWQGKVLRVNLTAGTCEGEELNMDWAFGFLGQRGLGTKYMMAESDPAADPLSPGNNLIFATGPLTGTPASTGGRYSVITKGALGGVIACSNSGGHFGAELKNAGWDMVIFEGRSEKPVYLFIDDDEAQLLDASEIWGKSVWETEPAIKSMHQDPEIKIASIGVAGEKMVRFACVVNDLDRAAGRSGVGAVMGSKQLKAIAVKGNKGIGVKDMAAFLAAAAVSNKRIADDDEAKGLTEDGTMSMMNVTNSYGSLPTRNNRELQFDGIDTVNLQAMKAPRKSDGKTNLKTNKACFACTIGCGRVAQMDPDHFSLSERKNFPTVSGGLEYESGYSLGPMVGVDDIEAATYANYVCNEQGMDPISFGATLSAAMELFETGAITQKETGGINLKFGSAEALVKMVELTGRGEGFGEELGMGSTRLCEKYGHPEFSMAVKGQEIPGYDGRAMQGMGLAYATSNRGACHLRASTYGDDFEHIRPEGKAKVVVDTQNDASTTDSAGICQFPGYSMEEISALLSAACEGDWSEENLAVVGERIWNLEKQFNLAAGLTMADDTLPERMLKEPAPSGAAKGRVCELDKMLPEYYELRGWDKKGEPTKKTLTRLSLD
ncbi:MAG: aldehyde ferredoxin oxidoreductase family protein [Rhodospirillaceae bacterium]|jgi:aldehyde:ferredoxin oxidoreductase|nr:aldehyde ferredoxin oxidoreductase family protein [Rhodospirillaceae bacterium]MBT5245012.1 aldehyde ferredoxin oxidoreductase family protein [Rhodospirillaceae bacterium]MBT5561102.1 aldehyde ferredoxin oxidoreductase family protein [Rhodospirillaceae bacterium]MBT6241013.1 aldehyde ferredoxin oxidoreductase family protein [Rhodospirillaceae bacterium]